MADETASRASKCRVLLARAAAITVIVVLGGGLAATYGELARERDAGRDRTAQLEENLRLLHELQADNDALQKDNDRLRALIDKQSVLLQKLARGEKVTDAELAEATGRPIVIVRPRVVVPPSATPEPTPTVVPTPRPTPTPVIPVATPTPSPTGLCVPLLNLCL